MLIKAMFNTPRAEYFLWLPQEDIQEILIQLENLLPQV